MSTSDSYLIPDREASSDNDDIDSLPSLSSSEISSEADSDAQREWEQSLEQLQLLLTMVIIPFTGKYFGRKFAYWSEYNEPWRFTFALAFSFHAGFKVTNSNHSTDCDASRLGTVHGVGPQCRDKVDKQEVVSGGGCSAGCCDFIALCTSHI